MKRLGAVLLVCAGAGLALAQLDDSPWPTFRANNLRTGAVHATAPATELAWRITVGTVTAGGIQVASNGDIYYKSNDTDNVYVYRINAKTGEIIKQSVNLGGNSGSYASVAVGVDKVYTCLNTDTRICILDKETLEVVKEIRNGAFASLRSTPLLSTVNNKNGHMNIYVYDRANQAIHAVDSETDELMWSAHDIAAAQTSFGQMGPMWTLDDGRQVIAFFPNDSFMTGMAVVDNGDNTFDQLWGDLAGPECFNWWGSGAMSADGKHIYVTTFWDCGLGALWAINTSDGQVAWSVPSNKDDGDDTNDRNFFPRPATVGDRVYAAGGGGVLTCAVDKGDSYEIPWEFRADPGTVAEFTAVSVCVNPEDGKNYIYCVDQGRGITPERGQLFVFRDDGDSFEKVYYTDLSETGEMMITSIFGGSAGTIDGDGSVYVGSGNRDNSKAEMYKFQVKGPGYVKGDANGDGFVDFNDIDCFVAALIGLDNWLACGTGYDAGGYVPANDINGDGSVDFNDIDGFVECIINGGC